MHYEHTAPASVVNVEVCVPSPLSTMVTVSAVFLVVEIVALPASYARFSVCVPEQSQAPANGSDDPPLLLLLLLLQATRPTAATIESERL